MSFINLGILAHVDAGKTSLTERLLYAAGVIDEIGSVDDGSTQTDSLALERQRGITIRSAVATFALGDVTVNLIDTPGHPDFIAEVERVLSVLDGAVLVVSAVEGVQPQTRILHRVLRRLGIPTLIFVNKIDRGGARPGEISDQIRERLAPATVVMGAATGAGGRSAAFVPHDFAEPEFAGRLLDLLTVRDGALLDAYVTRGGAAVAPGDLRRSLADQVRRGQAYPLLFGSAITGAGVDSLMDAVRAWLPEAGGDGAGPVSGRVFKIERGPAGEKIAYARLFSGTVRVRDHLGFADGRGPRRHGKLTGLSVSGGSPTGTPTLSAGQIGRLRGLADIRVGDTIGVPLSDGDNRHFAPPTLETVVASADPARRADLRFALAQLAEQDPLIDLRQDDVRDELSVSLFGEVQKEVIQATLAAEYGIEVAFRATTTICVERPAGTGAAVEVIYVDPNPFLATVGLRIEPAPVGGGIDFRTAVPVEAMPLWLFKTADDFRAAVAGTVRETLGQGLHGWPVTDCVVTLTHSGYNSPGSTVADFRRLTPLVVMAALQEAGTSVCEPVHGFRLDGPLDTLDGTLRVLARLDATPRSTITTTSAYALEGRIRAARVHELQQRVPGLTRGEGVLETAFSHYEPVRGHPPVRARTDLNPLHRKEYLLHVLRRV